MNSERKAPFNILAVGELKPSDVRLLKSLKSEQFVDFEKQTDIPRKYDLLI